MYQQKQGTRVRIASHENVISMSDVYIPSESVCSCTDCESTGCINVRNLNSGIPCSCTDCKSTGCFKARNLNSEIPCSCTDCETTGCFKDRNLNSGIPCSCTDCKSTGCFKARNLNSGIPCSCTDCETTGCFKDRNLNSEIPCSCTDCKSTGCFKARNVNSGIPCSCTDCETTGCFNGRNLNSGIPCSCTDCETTGCFKDRNLNSEIPCSCTDCKSTGCFKARNVNSGIPCSCTDCETTGCFNGRNLNSGIPCSCKDCESTGCFDTRNLNSGIPCSCTDCETTGCFNGENLNSGIPCSCTDCDANGCSTWEFKNNEPKPNNETRNMNMTPVIPKDLIKEIKKNKITCSYLDNDLQNYTSDDPELKEVFTKQEKRVGKSGAQKKFLENDIIDAFEIKDSSNENSDIIECGAKDLEKYHSNNPKIKQVLANDGSDTKISWSINKTLELKNSRDHENKQLLSKINMPFYLNDSKELLMKKIRNSFSEKISTDNIESDSPEVFQIFKNEKEGIVKCCDKCYNTEEQYINASEKKQDYPENKIPYSKVNSKDIQLKIKDEFSDIDLENCTTYSYKDVSHTLNKINVNKNNKSYEKYVSHLQSVAIRYARPENSRGELSAQIMNVPYDKFKDSLSTKQSPTDSNTCNSSTKIGTFDIFAKLKEIYKACSCKVCECIGGKSLFNQTEICQCGPCDCDDSNGLMAKLQKKIDNAPHSGCPCIRCDRKDCRGVVKSTSDDAVCDCEPCECYDVGESITKPCSCAPCQCEKCTASIFIPQSLTAASAAKSFPKSYCDCDPCECKQTSRSSAMTSKLMREVSTGITYGNSNCEECTNDACQLGQSDCRCESQQHKVIRKPIVEKKSNYGIHRVQIKEDKYEKKTGTKNNHNTIAMYALSNNYPKILFNYSNKLKTCECDVCECIVCKDKGKGSIVNKTHVIDKPNCDFNTSPRNSCECSPCECQKCTRLHADNIEGKSYMETGYDACNCRSSKHLGYTCGSNNNNNDGENYNFEKVKPTYSMVENDCMRKLRENFECKNLVNMHSQSSMDIDIDVDVNYLHDNDKFYHLKKGTLLTPSMFENKGLKSNSSHIHLKPKIESLKANDLGKNIFRNEQNTKPSRSKSRHSYFDTEYKDITNNTLESSVKVKSTNSSLMNMVSKEVGTNEIYKIHSIDFKQDNNSKVFYEHSKSTVQNDDSNKLLEAGLAHMPTELSSHCNKKLEHYKDLNTCSQTSLERQELDDSFYKTISSSKNYVQFSSAKSMSLVKLMCKERNLNIDNKNTRNFLQSLEKIPLKRIKMDEENVSFNWDKTFNDDNYSYPFKNNLLVNMDQHKLSAFNCENKKLEKDLTDKKKENNYVHDKNAVEEPFPKTTNVIRPKEEDNFQIVERKPNNYNIRANGSLVQPKINKPCSEAKVAKSNVKSKTGNHSKSNVNKVNNKRSLEIPDVTNTATSAVRFAESDKCIDFEKSFKLLKEVNFSYGEKKKASPILRKNFFFNPVGKNERNISTTFELDVKNAVKSTSFQTNIMFPYSPGRGFGNIALTKLQTEVNELLYSPLLQSSPAYIQTEKLRSKSKHIPELNGYMSDATSQTNRQTIFVDKEINSNMIESRENLRQSIKNLINMTLTNVVDPTDVEMRKQHFIRDFNKESSLHPASSSYGRLKARFVGLRKVSDHSVLLKWAMPSDRSKIQGYEVDGRPVKKILNPTRCMAVLTCLPHYEKLLLTIRTLTNVETGHIPVTTIVYKPKRNKSES